ncbi:MAG: N-acetylmuramoyl-L-alanine amidase [Candidatus Omnitrophica bacterium]|nr:N-acetylmuramoyl-L-alanine amidase [Candidatus Omnitrophota bacterium]
MQRIKQIILIIFLISLNGCVIVPIKEQKISTVRKCSFPISTKIKKVVIDAGHGGNDPGAIGRTGLREKDVNLDIAKRLAALLKSEGVEVVLTRSSDRYIPLDTRVQITNNSKADLFISVHSNANRSRSMNGFEIYYVATSVSDSTRAMIAARSSSLNLENADFASHSLALKAMLWDMIYTYDRAESIYLGRSICRSIGDNLDVRVIGVKNARYVVLRGARMPAILIEVGFLSNSQEERMLRNAAYRAKIAQGILYGISNYAQGLALAEVTKR